VYKKNLKLILAGIILLPGILFSQTWNPRVRLTYNTSPSRSPYVVANSNKVLFVFWNDALFGDNEIFYKVSYNGGTIWSVSKRLTWNNENSAFPNVAVDSNNDLHLVYQDSSYGNFEIFYKKGMDGLSWSPITRLSWNTTSSLHPVIAVDSSDDIYVFWYDSCFGNAEIVYKKSTDGGNSWSSLNRLTWNTDVSTDPTIAIGPNDHINIAWSETKGAYSEIMFKKSQNGGVTWSAPVRITYNSVDSERPRLAVNTANVLFLVWYNYSGSMKEVYFKKSIDNGQTWSTLQRLTYNTGLSFYPVITTGPSSTVHVIWLDRTPGNDEVYYKQSTNGGLNWSPPARLTWTIDWASGPHLCTDVDNNIFVVYAEDLSLYGSEIYFRKSK